MKITEITEEAKNDFKEIFSVARQAVSKHLNQTKAVIYYEELFFSSIVNEEIEKDEPNSDDNGGGSKDTDLDRK